MDQPLEPEKQLVYAPCKLCGSVTYDQGDIDEEKLAAHSIYEPSVCDECNWGNIRGSGIPIH